MNKSVGELMDKWINKLWKIFVHENIFYLKLLYNILQKGA